jgi:uncharacterized membrane protein YphA (DoxX/SURF4 family)
MSTKIFTPQPVWTDGIVIIRICTGILIVMFGKEIFDGALMTDYGKFLQDAGFPAPHFMAYLAKLVELAGGCLLILGLFTRLIVFPLMFTMAVIIWHMSEGNFFNGGTASTFLLLFLLFFFTGPGRYSLDYVFFGKRGQASI